MRYVIALLCCFFLISLPSIAEVKSISLTANEWPPYTSDAIEGGGLVIELVTAAFAEEGISTHYQIMPWARAIASVEALEVDAVGAWDSQDRRKKFWFSDRLMINKMMLLKRKEKQIHWQTLDDLKRYTFVLVRGAVSLADIDNSTEFKKTYVTGEETAMSLVVKGRADLTLRDQGMAEYLIKQKPELFAGKVSFVGQALGQNPLHLVVSRQHPDGQFIIEAFNRGLKKIKTKGIYQALGDKYGISLSD